MMAEAEQPHVSRDDLRSALAASAGARPPRTIVLDANPQGTGTSTDARAWDWDLDQDPRAELEAALARGGTLQQRLEEAEQALAAAEHREHIARDGLIELAAAGPLARRNVIAELRLRGVL